jgi:hypothetical protein
MNSKKKEEKKRRWTDHPSLNHVENIWGMYQMWKRKVQKKKISR